MPAADSLNTSSFQGITFGWDYGSPQKERRDGLDHYTGTIWMNDHALFNTLYALQRPVSVTAITPTGPIYIDWWGPDPSGALLISDVETLTAILVDMKGVKWMSSIGRIAHATPIMPIPEIHQATVDFLIRP